MPTLKLKRGPVASLPASITAGELLLTTDTLNLYSAGSDGAAPQVVTERYSKYQIVASSTDSTPVAGCYVIATGPVYGAKEGTDGSFKTLRVKIPTGVKVRMLQAYYTTTEIGATTKYAIIVFDTGAGYIGMPNNPPGTAHADFFRPAICCYSGTAATGDLLPAVVPKFTSQSPGSVLDLNAIGVAATTQMNLAINVIF